MDEFGRRTEAYVAWLNGIGITMSQKVQIADLRTLARGRGVGEF
jgi:uncharacterized protein (DUF1697 family)